MATFWETNGSILFGGLLTILGSILAQIFMAINEKRKWEEKRKISLQDRKNDLRIKANYERCEQIEKAVKIISQDLFHIEYAFQALFVYTDSKDLDLNRAGFEKLAQEWKNNRDPELQEYLHLKAVVDSIDNSELSDAWGKLATSWSLSIAALNDLSRNYDEFYIYYELENATLASFRGDKRREQLESSKRIYQYLFELKISL